eukprot:3548685-Prorocentrum_lima.AAC.1
MCAGCSTYYDIEAGREHGAACMRGKGRGKSGQQRRNRIGSDGSPMKCSTCGSEYQLRRWCPEEKEKAK